MGLCKTFMSGFLAASLMAGMQMTGLAEEAENPGISVELEDGAKEGVLQDTGKEMPEGSSLDISGTQQGILGLGQTDPEDDTVYTTIEEWGIKVPIPDHSTSIKDGDTGEFYIYTQGEGIPYVMALPYEYTDGEVFLSDFTDYMREVYPDLEVTDEIHETQIGSYSCWQTMYEYKVSGYMARDRRVAIEHGGMIYMFASKEIPELELEVGNLLDETVEGLIFLDGEDGNIATNTGSASPTAFTVTKVADVDSGLTIGRIYAPSDYAVDQYLGSYGTGGTDCSPACPWQLSLSATSPDGQENMGYISQMVYTYSAQMYQEGQMLYGICTMLEPMTASAYADCIILSMYGDVGDITITAEKELSASDEAYLQDRAQEIYDTFAASIVAGSGISLEGAVSTYTEREYAFNQDGQAYAAIVVTATDLVQYSQSMGTFTDTMVQMTIPYVYVYTAPADRIDAGRTDFELFRANTRITDEFAVAMGQMSLALQNAITSGTNPDISDEEIAKILGTEDGSFDTDGFCDYILSQETYTTSDGKEIKVPNSYDYVYEGDNGDIYVSDTADAPAGSIQLQKK